MQCKVSPVCRSAPDEFLDLRGVECPHNTSAAMLRLEVMDEGELLELLIDDGEPRENVPVSLTQEGHRVLEVTAEDGAWRMRVERGPDV